MWNAKRGVLRNIHVRDALPISHRMDIWESKILKKIGWVSDSLAIWLLK